MSNIIDTPSPHHSSRRGMCVAGTVLHYTAGGSARGSARWFANLASRVSSQWIISRSGQWFRCVDEGRAAWHAEPGEMEIDGEVCSDLNELTIGIELANHGWLVRKNESFFYQIGGQLLPYRRAKPIEAVLVFDNGIEVPGFWEPYPDTQIDSLQSLIRQIHKRHGAGAAHNLMGHEEIAVPLGTRKRDPGGVFPWERFSRKAERRTLVHRA